MNADNYPITFAYGDVDGVYYTNLNPHRGNDRPTPSGTPVVIGGVTIGLTGNTGLTSGPHIHLQAGYDEWCQSTVEPSPYEFQPGTVTSAGYGSQWGNYIIIRTLSGVYICYAHLSQINVQEGQVIGENRMTEDGVRFGILAVTGGKLIDNYEKEVKYWTGRDSTEFSKYLYGMSDYFMVPAHREIAALKKQLADTSGGYEPATVYIKKG